MQRRHFLATGVMAAMARGEVAEPLGIGQIGTRHSHAAGKMAAVRALPGLWRVAGLVPEGETDHAAYRDVPRVGEAELLQNPEVRAVVVETELATACATARRALEAGKHVHLDKPGALDHAEFAALHELATAHGLTVQMGYMLRYNPAFELLFRMVREGWLGEVTAVDASMGKLADEKLREVLRGLPGAGMFELGCHLVDVALTVLGGPPEEVTAFTAPTRPEGLADHQFAVLRYPRALVTLRCHHADPFGGPQRFCAVIGTEGSCRIEPLESGRITVSLRKAREDFPAGQTTRQLIVPTGRYEAEFRDLAAIVRAEKPLAWSAAHDVAVHRTTLLAAGVRR